MFPPSQIFSKGYSIPYAVINILAKPASSIIETLTKP